MKFIEAENRGPEESGSQYLMSEEVIKYEVPINIKLTCNTKQKTTTLSNAFFSSKLLGYY